jgi:hypothetical protein
MNNFQSIQERSGPTVSNNTINPTAGARNISMTLAYR